MTSPTVELPAAGCATVAVSWDGTASFTGPFDDVTRDTAGDPGLSIDVGKDGARQLSPPKVSACDFELFNHTATYSQEKPDSPVYQQVIPGRPVRVTYAHGAAELYDTDRSYDGGGYYDGVGTYSLARTAIDDLSQRVELGAQRVALTTLGVERLMTYSTVTVPLMVNPRVSDCISALLDAVGWPSSQRAIATSDTHLLYWWCDDRHPWDALIELLASEGPGAVYVTGDQVFHFENRNYRATTPRCTTPQASFADHSGGAATDYDTARAYDSEEPYDAGQPRLWFTGLSYDPGYKNIVNRATMATRVRAAGTPGTVMWQYGAALVPAAGAGTTLIVRPQNPFTAAIVPVLGTDYTVAGGTVSVSLSAASGFVAFLTVTATSGTPTVSGLQLRGTPLAVVAETTVQNSVDASASIARFSPIPGQSIPRVMDVGGWAEIDPAEAIGVCNAWVSRYMLQRPQVTIEVRNADGAHLAELLRRTISDRISIQERNTGLSADVWINERQLVIAGARGADVRAVFGCEKVDEVVGDVWGASDTDPLGAHWDVSRWGV